MTDILGTAAAPGWTLDEPPALTQSPLSLVQLGRFLIDEERNVDPSNGRWQAGVTWRPRPTAKAGGIGGFCGDTNIVFDDDDCDTPPVALPFWVTYSSRAPLSQFSTLDYKTRAEEGLIFHEVWRVENEWWTGTLQPNNEHLAMAGATVGTGIATTATAVGLRRAIAAADQAIADADIGVGMIHMTPYILEMMAFLGMPIVRENGRPLTVNGNIIVPGNGYDGSGPDGDQPSGYPDKQYIYATPMVYLLRGTIDSMPEQYPANFTGGNMADFGQALIDVGTQVPMRAVWTAKRPWMVIPNPGLRCAVLVDTSL